VPESGSQKSRWHIQKAVINSSFFDDVNLERSTFSEEGDPCSETAGTRAGIIASVRSISVGYLGCCPEQTIEAFESKGS
jgi:hypothetical protein